MEKVERVSQWHKEGSKWQKADVCNTTGGLPLKSQEPREAQDMEMVVQALDEVELSDKEGGMQAPEVPTNLKIDVSAGDRHTMLRQKLVLAKAKLPHDVLQKHEEIMDQGPSWILFNTATILLDTCWNGLPCNLRVRLFLNGF